MSNKKKKVFITSLVGMVAVALCCFTPVLVITLTAVGLGVAIPYLDFILLPSLFVLLVLTVFSYRRWKNLGE